MALIQRIANRFRDKSRADYVATEKEMAEHTFNVYREQLSRSIDMGKNVLAKAAKGVDTESDWQEYYRQQSLAHWYGKQVNYGKLIFG